MNRHCSIGVAVLVSAAVLLLAPGWALAKKGGNASSPGQAKKAAATSTTETSQGAKEAHGKKDAAVVEQAPAGTPPGWSHGKKTGWHGMPYPPGWAKWDKNKQTTWVADRDRALYDIQGISFRYRIPEPKVNEITQAFGQAVAGGLIINDAREKLVTALKDESQRKALMIDTTTSVLQLLK